MLEELGPLTQPVAVEKTTDDKVNAADTPEPATVHSPRELTLSDQERQVLNLIPKDPVHIDEILRRAELEHSRILSTLTVLEMKRMIRRYPGSNYCRC